MDTVRELYEIQHSCNTKLKVQYKKPFPIECEYSLNTSLKTCT